VSNITERTQEVQALVERWGADQVLRVLVHTTRSTQHELGLTPDACRHMWVRLRSLIPLRDEP
jgi:hypothetical protein